MKPVDFWLGMAEWGSLMHNGDPGACMYGFDERGVVQSEKHRAACLAYIDGPCREAADINVAAGEDATTQHPHLDALRAHLLTVKVG